MFDATIASQRRIEDFGAMVKECSGLSMWHFDMQGNLLGTTCPDAAQFLMFLNLGNCLDRALEQQNDLQVPMVMEDGIGMMWAGDFLRPSQNQAPRGLMFLGPVFTAQSSLPFLQSTIQRLNLSVELTQILLDKLQTVPVLASSMMNQYVKMLHWILTGQVISSYAIKVLGGQNSTLPAEETSGEAGAGRIFATEEQLLQIIREGNPDYQSVMDPIIDAAPRSLPQMADALREAKNNVIAFTVLASRAAMQGGVAPGTAAELQRYYLHATETCRSYADLVELNNAMIEDFVHRVQGAKSRKGMSRTVRECCEYLQLHLTKPFDLQQMARSVGYTEYYLTKKFRRETGLKVTEYLKKARLEHARHLLEVSHESIQDISDRLQFSSRNHFSKAFSQQYGISPSAYREQYGMEHNHEKTKA